MTTKTLLQYLKEQGVTRKDLMTKCLIKSTTLFDWETKPKCEMKWSTAVLIFQTLNLSMREFLRINKIK